MTENTKENLAQIIETVLHVKPNTFLVLKPAEDESGLGDAVVVNQVPTAARIRAAISTPEKPCTMLDFIKLHVPGTGIAASRILMAVDDTGMLADLPKNALAFHVANSVRGYQHDIHGVAVVFRQANQ